MYPLPWPFEPLLTRASTRPWWRALKRKCWWNVSEKFGVLCFNPKMEISIIISFVPMSVSRVKCAIKHRKTNQHCHSVLSVHWRSHSGVMWGQVTLLIKKKSVSSVFKKKWELYIVFWCEEYGGKLNSRVVGGTWAMCRGVRSTLLPSRLKSFFFAPTYQLKKATFFFCPSSTWKAWWPSGWHAEIALPRPLGWVCSFKSHGCKVVFFFPR